MRPARLLTRAQVLVWDDVMGTWAGHKAKFVRRFADVKAERERGVQGYVDAVRAGTFPDMEHESYIMDKGEWARFLEGVGEREREREAGAQSDEEPDG